MPGVLHDVRWQGGSTWDMNDAKPTTKSQTTKPRRHDHHQTSPARTLVKIKNQASPRGNVDPQVVSKATGSVTDVPRRGRVEMLQHNLLEAMLGLLGSPRSSGELHLFDLLTFVQVAPNLALYKPGSCRV
ncbi:hypothetical protein MCOR25_001925 [Pyricularia grisea]|nr:hypothetical protein MCOR25_001925 [Pyricularia grisea]